MSADGRSGPIRVEKKSIAAVDSGTKISPLVGFSYRPTSKLIPNKMRSNNCKSTMLSSPSNLDRSETSNGTKNTPYRDVAKAKCGICEMPQTETEPKACGDRGERGLRIRFVRDRFLKFIWSQRAQAVLMEPKRPAISAGAKYGEKNDEEILG